MKKVVFTIEYSIIVTDNMVIDIERVIDTMTETGHGKILDVRLDEVGA